MHLHPACRRKDRRMLMIQPRGRVVLKVVECAVLEGCTETWGHRSRWRRETSVEHGVPIRHHDPANEAADDVDEMMSDEAEEGSDDASDTVSE